MRSLKPNSEIQIKRAIFKFEIFHLDLEFLRDENAVLVKLGTILAPISLFLKCCLVRIC